MNLNINKSIVLFLIISMSFNSASFAMNIHQAVQRGDLDRVRALIRANSNVVNQLDQYQMSPLHYAVQHGHAHIVDFLLQNNAVVDVQDSRQQTPLHRCVHENIARILLNYNADIRAIDLYDNTPLHTIIGLCGVSVNRVQLLLQHGAIVDARNVRQRTPLHFAAMYGDSNIALLLLNNNADIDARDNDGKIPLDFAKTYDHNNVVQLLKDWPLYKAYMRRQALAFAMITHSRLGAHSAAHVLDSVLCGHIFTMVVSHAPDEIHQIANQKRRRQQNCCPIVVLSYSFKH